MRYTTRPISDRTWLGKMGKKATQFQASWSNTLDLLDREVGALKGRDVVIEIDVAEQDLRLDGTLRATARAATSAVVLAFESKHGPLLYRCDRFYTNWHHQGPEWLRAVDRYGATETGQQYTGFKALPAGRAMPASHMTSDEALDVIWTAADRPAPDTPVEKQLRAARARSHPDRNSGARDAWDQVEQAAAVLGTRPMSACPECNGTGLDIEIATGRVLGDCRVCKGTGKASG